MKAILFMFYHIFAIFYYNDVNFIYFMIILLVTWYIATKIIIKIFKINSSKWLIGLIFFILNLCNSGIYFDYAKKITKMSAISMNETKKCLNSFEIKYLDDDFYIVSPMSEDDRGIYYGEFYSRRLKELKYGGHFTVSNERGIVRNYSFENYKEALIEAERNRILEKELSNILGNRIKLRLRTDKDMTADEILKNTTDKNSNKTIGVSYLSIYIFLDKDESKEEYQEKINKVSKYIFEDLKMKGYNFNVKYVDSCYLNDYESAKKLIYSPQQDDENGKKY